MTLSKIAQQLNDARRAVAQFTLLNTAQQRVDELTAAYDVAKAEQDHDAAEKAAAAHEALMDGITDVSVTDKGAAGDSLLRRCVQITYTRMAFDSRAGCSFPKQHVVEGFTALPAPVMLYLQEKRPDQIPAALMALAPNDPRAAFTRYAHARLRGHL